MPSHVCVRPPDRRQSCFQKGQEERVYGVREPCILYVHPVHSLRVERRVWWEGLMQHNDASRVRARAMRVCTSHVKT